MVLLQGIPYCKSNFCFVIGVDGLNGDGDIFSPQNQSAFADFIMKSTGGKGVHFAMADGVIHLTIDLVNSKVVSPIDCCLSNI